MKFSVNSPCPCGSGKKYKKCCGILHKGAIAKDALELMKSRYSAFAVGNVDYIIKTSTFQKDKDDLKSFCDACVFYKLQIIDFTPYEDEAFVTFKATISCAETDNSFSEKSRFIKQNGRWLYESGEIL